MKQIEVTIMGQSYVLGCPEGGEGELLAAVARVDREMSAIRDAGRVKARERIAVLAALNLAFVQQQRSGDGSGKLPVGEATEHGEIDVDALVRRIDHALEQDGQLL